MKTKLFSIFYALAILLSVSAQAVSTRAWIREWWLE